MFSRALFIVLASLFALFPTAANADTLIVATGGGNYKAGIAKSWRSEGNTVTFVLADGVDGQQVAAFLKERLAQATVAYADGTLKITGIPAVSLLEQLSTLAIAEGDPLIALAALGGSAPTTQGPEAGGSIRAHNSIPMASLLGNVTDTSRAERFDAEVVEITRGSFPQVTLTLRVRKLPSAGSLVGKITIGKIMEMPVMLVGEGGNVDFGQKATQRNLAAFYAKKGDRVIVHAITNDNGSMVIDWVERK
jgi:hypothetical protein